MINDHPVKQLYSSLTNIVSPAMGKPVVRENVCDRCGCLAQDGYYSKETYRVYGTKNVLFHCSACHSLDVGDKDITGIERAAGPNFVPNKFGMMVSTGAAIEIETGKTIFFAPLKIIDKLPPSFLDTIDTRPIMGQSQIPIILREITPPLLYISDFGRKTDLLVANLTITRRMTALLACSDNGVVEINVTSAMAVHDVLRHVENKQFTIFTNAVSQLSRGIIKPEAFLDLLADDPELQTAFKLLPIDPHLRLKLIPLLGNMRVST